MKPIKNVLTLFLISHSPIPVVLGEDPHYVAPFVPSEDCVYTCSTVTSYDQVCDVECQCPDDDDVHCFYECQGGSWLKACYGGPSPPEIPDESRSSGAFVTSEECETPCGEVTSFTDDECDYAEIGSCTCTKETDEYCAYQCTENSHWLQICQGRNQFSNGDTSNPPIDTTDGFDTPFITPAECKAPCSNVNSFDGDCDSTAIGLCHCVSPTDKYCSHECDNGKWLMMCQSVHPQLPNGDTSDPPIDTTDGFDTPFTTPAECKAPCSSVNSFDGDCNSTAIGVCHCVSPTDKYCSHECDNSKWLTMCQSVRPGINDTKSDKGTNGTKSDDNPNPDDSGGVFSPNMTLFVSIIVTVVTGGNLL